MEEIMIKDKQKYLDENYPFVGTPKITEIKTCIHCGKKFKVGDYRVFKDITGFEAICCPNVLECGGTVIDWID
jgi:hypothetical protein